jgi:hypothetical protein
VCTSRYPSPRATALVVLLVVTAALAACQTPTKQVAAFGKATRQLTENARNAYDQVHEATVQRKIFALAAEPSRSPTDETFEGLLRQEQQALKMKLLKNLGDYAEALGTLSTADSGKDMEKASKELYGSVAGLNGTYQKLTKKTDPLIPESELELFATAVDGIGTFLVEHKRRKAIRTIVNGAHTGVEKASELLAQELPPLGPIVRLDLDTTETELVKAYQKSAPKMSLARRVAALEEIRVVNRAKNEAIPLFEKLGKAAAQVGTAHAKLKEAANAGDYTSADFIAAIGQLRDYAESINEFRESLGKK